MPVADDTTANPLLGRDSNVLPHPLIRVELIQPASTPLLCPTMVLITVVLRTISFDFPH
jgi:hypothetical protein